MTIVLKKASFGTAARSMAIACKVTHRHTAMPLFVGFDTVQSSLMLAFRISGRFVFQYGVE